MTADRPSEDEVQIQPPAARRRRMNEVEAMGRWAARGAGLPWGIAEEAGKAARWLTARGLPGIEQLADVLTRDDGCDYEDLAPADVDGVWRASAGRLCPLIAGAALCDRAAEIAAGRVITLGETAQPLLLLPYAAAAAKLSGAAIAIGWDGVVVTLSTNAERIDGRRDALTAASADRVRCQRAGHVDELSAPVEGHTGPDVTESGWSRLEALARRTYAPATAASRLSGAGAGLSDNN